MSNHTTTAADLAELDRQERLTIECRILDLLELVERFDNGDKTVTLFAYDEAMDELAELDALPESA
jgi:hypothetical protein